MTLLEVKALKKTYTTRLGGHLVPALTNVTFSVEKGEYLAIMGESGSGKTTLLNIVASLDQPTGGQVLLEGKDIGKIRERDLAEFRRKNLGFVFQDFNLLDTFSLRDNIYLPLVLSGMHHEEMARRLAPLAKKLSIEDILEKYPYEVSGGQKQRVAVAVPASQIPGFFWQMTHRCAGLPVRRSALGPFDRSIGRADHPHGDPLRQSGQPRQPGPFH